MRQLYVAFSRVRLSSEILKYFQHCVKKDMGNMENGQHHISRSTLTLSFMNVCVCASDVGCGLQVSGTLGLLAWCVACRHGVRPTDRGEAYYM